MNEYIATCHTHLSALLTCRALNKQGISAKMAPVPRKLSSSCGTCVCYTAADACWHLLDQDTEAVYRCEAPEEYILLPK